MNSNRDHGQLADWQTADLPEPLPFSFRNALKTIGPGAILLAGSIGGGEWIVGPLVAVKYGPSILWIATVGIVLQMLFNLEAIRYTLYTGEPILTGIMRLNPGPRLWAVFYIAFGIAQLATPALALGCANVVFSAFKNQLPGSDGSDSMALLWISYGILFSCVLILLSGRSIERVLERLSWIMVFLIFAFLFVVNVLFVPADTWLRTAAGFFTLHALPEDADLVLLALFAATAGSGGFGNLAISNWVRDKGFGMGAHMGGYGGVLAGDHVELKSIGHVFPINDANLVRWGHWWKYVLTDQVVLWALGCLVGMYLNVNLASELVPPNTELSGTAAGAFQARYMADQLWAGFWVLCLLNGFWVLFSTQLGNMDILTRVVADVLWAGSPRVQQWASSRVYAGLLLLFFVFGIGALTAGENAVQLFKVLGVMASPILAIGAVQILIVNTRFLPAEIRPPMWRRLALVLCALFYGGIAIGLTYDFVMKLMPADT